ncbi:MAG: hypothetical protein IJ667_13420 [Synergistaceae bacterium]|nr:hypothetical protein [Synergistaceae bacterium]
MDFSRVTDVTIAEGTVSKIQDTDLTVLWQKKYAPSGSVLARGTNAAVWGANGVDTDDGVFRILQIPKAVRLDQLTAGFGAKITKSDAYYVCGTYDVDQTVNDAVWISASTPLRLEDATCGGNDPSLSILGVPIEGMSSGMVYHFWSTSTPSYHFNARSYIYVMYLLKDGGIFIRTSIPHIWGTNYDSYPKETNTRKLLNCNAIQSAPGEGNMSWIAGDGKVCYMGRDSSCKEYTVSAASTAINSKVYATAQFMYEDSNEQIKINGSAYNPDIFGSVKDFWTIAFILNEDNELYAIGTSSDGCLGLSPTGGNNGGAVYSVYTKVGVFDVKKIQRYGNSTFLLTNDGELYHAGVDANITGDDTHYEFTRVFPDYKFIDIAYSTGTLVAILEEH